MFEKQIKTSDGWKSSRPTGGTPYQYKTRDEARRMLEITYPDQCVEARLQSDHGYYKGIAGIRIIEVAE